MAMSVKQLSARMSEIANTIRSETLKADTIISLVDRIKSLKETREAIQSSLTLIENHPEY